MTEQVRVPGFSVPPAPAGATEHSREQNRPTNPADMQPGFVAPPREPAPAPTQAQGQTQAPAPQVDPTVAALLAALSGKGTEATATEQAPQAGKAGPTSADPVVNSLSGILVGAGVDVERAIAKAIEYGDVGLIDKHYLEQVGGKNASYLTTLAESLVQHTGRESAAAEASCYALAGGKENFSSAVGVFNQSAPAHMQVVVRTMMDSGIRAQSDAAAKLIVDFAKGNGGLIQQAGLVTGAAGPGAEQALSKEQFQSELYKLDKNAVGYEQRRGELFGRRAIGKSLGR